MPKVALVTGASRGIGKATALALAQRGFDVAITARSLREGQGRFEYSPVAKTSHIVALPGSLETTAREIVALGRRAFPIVMDLLDRSSVDGATASVRKTCGHVDVLVNNAIYQGQGTMDRVCDLNLDHARDIYDGNVVAQLQLIQNLLPGMLERRSGVIVNLVSASGMMDPPAPAGEGGWGFAYAASKAALGRLAGVLAVELRNSGVRVHAVEPGLVITELMKATGLDEQLKAFAPSPPTLPAAVIAWLASEPDAEKWNGKTVSATEFSKQHGLE